MLTIKFCHWIYLFALNQQAWLSNINVKISIVLDKLFCREKIKSQWGKPSVPIFFFRYPTLYDGSFDIQDIPVKQESYWPVVAYNQSKLCNMLFAFELNRRLSPYGVYCNAVHPGNYISSNIARNSIILRLLNLMTRPFSKSTVSFLTDLTRM